MRPSSDDRVEGAERSAHREEGVEIIGRVRRAGVIAILGLAVTAATAVGGPPWPYSPPPSHEDEVGAHSLVDTEEYAGVRCRYGSGGTLESLRIRRPIAFARDARAGTDSGAISWRYDVWGWDPVEMRFEKVDQGPIRKLTATDSRNADFQPVVHRLGPLEHLVYRVRHRLVWFRPGHRDQPIGSAIHWVKRYANIGGTWGLDVDVCFTALSMPPPSTEPDGHTGAYGTHLLMDQVEAPGLICRYGDAPPYALEVMRVRPAIAFAIAGTQRIRRSLLVQYTDDPGPDPTWSTWSTSVPVARDARAEHNAVFPAVSLPLGGDGPDHPRWRVVQRLRWPSGRADEVAAYTLQDDGDPQVGGPTCFGSD